MQELSGFVGIEWSSISNPEQFNYNIATFCDRNDVGILSDVNSRYKYVKQVDSYLGYHVVRDPRDILVSSYFSSLKTHSASNWPELETHRAALSEATREDGLFLEIDFIADVFEALENWNYEDPRILEVKMEDLMQDNYSGFMKIAVHLGLVDEGDESTSSILVQTRNQLRLLRNRLAEKSSTLSWLASYPERIPVLNLLGIIHRNRFAAKAGGRGPGKEDSNSHYRKGVSGDWRNHFTTKIEQEFKARYGELLIQLGYEEDRHWSFKHAI
jgi:hypothetical protein